jgi:hypothetical protein
MVLSNTVIFASIVNVLSVLDMKTLVVEQHSVMLIVKDMPKIVYKTVTVLQATVVQMTMYYVLHATLTVMHVQQTMKQTTVGVQHVLQDHSRVILPSSTVLPSVQLDTHLQVLQTV